MGLGWVDDAALVLGTELSVAQVLSEGVRTVVARCWVDGSTTATDGARTVVAKCFRSKAMAHNSGGFGIVREVCGLGTIPGAPHLYAADLDLGVVVMEDVAGVPLASLLSGADAEATLSAGAQWGLATARVMASSVDAVPSFREAVRRADPDSRSAGGPASPQLPRRGLERLCRALEIEVPDDAMVELAAVDLLNGGEDAVVTQADPCPGNVLIGSRGARFVDFEATSVHHPAIDVVNLLMPWSTCDGMVGVPAEFLDAVRDGFIGGHPRAAGWLAADSMIGLAGTAAALQLTELSLEPLRRRGDVAGRARMVHRWRWARAHADLTDTIGSLCGRMVDLAVDGWGWPSRPDLAPCFTNHGSPPRGRNT
ncbi:phosphotransferase [Acidipropionibacterium timonense]|uniref:phosphotransferase n=1 Tax=Acidipropionibacterium timonense TaxID=2161818 RepID=UPI00103270B1|nr:phosphotransferase [Acidipropionibacterium timonense]